MKKRLIKVIPIIITILVIVLIVMSGPAQAFSISLNIPNNSVIKGNKINMDVSVKIESNEYLNISYFVLKLKGSKNIECRFDVDGIPLYDCEGINIQKISSPEYVNDPGYGYQGYNNGEFKFKLIISTNNLDIGIYKSLFDVFVNNQLFSEKKGKDIIIQPSGGGQNSNGCSIKADEGVVTINNKDYYDKNKLSFTIPSKNAVQGKGSLSGQMGKDRFTYDFSLKKTEKIDAYNVKVYVSGKYRVGRDDTKSEDSIIYLNTKTNTVKVSGSHINASDLVLNVHGKCGF